MKKLVGRRADVEMGSIFKLIKMLSSRSPNLSLERVFVLECNGCRRKNKFVFSEDLQSGDIWLEGPDNCSNCNNKLNAENPSDVKLSQSAITSLFDL